MNNLTNEQIKSILEAAERKSDKWISHFHGSAWWGDHNLSDLAEILALRERVEQQQDTIDKLLTLLNAADCPCCDKSGGYHDGYGLVQQCQWCDELNKLKGSTNERD